MSRVKPALSSAWLALASVAAALAACAEGDAHRGDAPGRGVYVQQAWQEARQARGHSVHVIEQKIPCANCHELTESSLGAATPERCAACHDEEATLVHAADAARLRFGPEASSDCTSCHAFGVEATAGAERSPLHQHFEAGDCARCHSQDQGSIPAVRVHETEDCVACHEPHQQAAPAPAPCSRCHDVSTTHGGHGSETHACTTCHQHQHAPAADARSSCVECHARDAVVPPTALFDAGHRECVGCHRPHDFEGSAAVACSTCHADVRVLGAGTIPAHNQCTNCHAAHDVQAGADQACAKCHGDKRPDHPKHGKTGSCVGCHDPHPSSGQAKEAARACSDCHQGAAHEQAFHGGVACVKCHTPHDFVRGNADHRACEGCHGAVLARVASEPGHQTCEGCHGGLPHRPATLTAGCADCHATAHAEVTRGHAECTSCHEPHAGAVATACRTCHEAEHRSAPAGHQACTQCHAPHSGAPDKANCASCHREEAHGTHSQLQGGCASCHRAHGPAGVARPPDCTSCHQKTALAGLHVVKEHQGCVRCHGAHEEPAGALRDACLTCHQDRKRHFPDAPRCANCHLFGATH
ncbi:MAG TPA: hypothetical protein VM686_07590 [Polyangiaceae bacterium]|nr:hypothetical protein [Polyangiaceae bacterium]